MGNASSKPSLHYEKECNVEADLDVTKMTLAEASRLYYRKKIFPLEEALCLDKVYQPPLCDAEFGAPPVLLFLGPFSAGKTTMIRHFLKMDYPGMTIGPVPSAERYSIIMYGQRQLLNSHVLIEDENFPFREIWRYGEAYLNKTYCAYCPANILRKFIIVDTPGVTNFDEKYMERDYSQTGVVRFWVDRADKIILVFDVHKLDIPDDFKQIINCIQPFGEKCLIVLNKADAVTPTELQRAIDLLTWSLGRIFKQNELPTLYIGSYWENGTTDPRLQKIINEYEIQFLEQLNQAEKDVDLRRLNDVILRANITYMHGLVSRMLTRHYTKKHLASKNFRRQFMSHLQKKIYPKLATKLHIQAGDLPHPLAVYKQITDPCYNIRKHPVSRQQISMLRRFLINEMPTLIKTVPEEAIKVQIKMPTMAEEGHLTGTLMTDDWCSVRKAGREHGWKARFYALKPKKGQLSWCQMKLTMQMTGLATTTLLYIWSLIDSNGDGRINENEYYLFNWLVQQTLDGRPLPHELPKALKPPQHDHDKHYNKKKIRITKTIPTKARKLIKKR